MLIRKKKEPLTPDETKQMSNHLEELNKEIESQMEEAVKLEEELINFMIENHSVRRWHSYHIRNKLRKE